jgi:hypothetical protein
MQGQQDEPLQHRQYLHHEHPALRRDGCSLSLISMLLQGQQDEPVQHRQYLHHEHPALRRDGSSLSLISMLILVLYFRTELIISY